jgi:hypothetical protein
VAQEILRPWLRSELTVYLFSQERQRPSVGPDSGESVSLRSNPRSETVGGVGRESYPVRSTTPTPTARRSITASTRPTRRPSGEPGRPGWTFRRRFRIGTRTNSATTLRLGSGESSAWTWPGPCWVIAPRS